MKFIFFSFLFISFPAISQNDLWPSDPVNTGSNATYLITDATDVTFNGQDFIYGKLGAFYTDDNGDLQNGGWIIWNNSEINFSVQADDSTTPEKDGFTDGEEITWLATNDAGTPTYQATVTYTMGTSYFNANSINIILEFEISNTVYCVNDTDGDGICDENESVGCTDENAFNYNPFAQVDDGSCSVAGCPYDDFFEYNPNYYIIDISLCQTLIVYGCTDALAENYNSAANIEDGSCEYIIGCTDPDADNYNIEAIQDDGSCIYYGCMDQEADNYDEQATQDDGNCIYFGCMNNTAENFNAQATDDDGSCIIYGCTIEIFPNYNPEATTDDLSCNFDSNEIYGCTDSDFIEYNLNASIDNGSCLILTVEGCTDEFANNYNSNANLNDGSCYTEIIFGCLDSSANNYNPNANTYDGSCTFDSGLNHIFISNPIDGFAYATGSDIIINYEFISSDITIGYSFQGADALIRYSLNGGSLSNIASSSGEISLGELSNGDYTLDFTLHGSGSGLPQWDPLVQTTVNFSIGPDGCTDEIACNYDSEAIVNNYSCIYPDTGYNCDGNCLIDTDGDGVCDDDEIEGCVDQIDPNYGFIFETDAGVCDYLGCTDSLYIEFNPIATIDDGSCETIVINVDSLLMIIDSLQYENNYFLDYINLLLDSIENQHGNIYIDLVEGWNMIGYTLPFPQDVTATVEEIVEHIEIIKNNTADVYWPEYGFNGIGDFIPGQGYQIRMLNAVDSYSFPDVGDLRIELTPTVPEWVHDLPILNHPNDTRSLVRVVNLLGQKVDPDTRFKGEILLYLFSDGTTEKKVVE